MKKRFSWLLVFVLLLSLAGLACETLAGDGGTVPDSNGADSGDSGDATDSGDSGDSGGSGDAGGEAQMVEGLPVTADATDIVNTNFNGIIAIAYKSDMSTADVAGFYRREMADLGYSVTTDSEASGSAALIFSGGSAGTVNVGIAPDPTAAGKTAVAVATQP